jgi:hypothetical protein
MRSTVIGASLGAAAVFGMTWLSDADHRISPAERLPYAWGLTAGGILTGAVARHVISRRCLPPPEIVVRDDRRACAGAAWRGAGIATVQAGAIGFVVAPIILLPVALGSALGSRPVHFGRDIGVVTVTSAAIGLPLGALGAYRHCKGR